MNAKIMTATVIAAPFLLAACAATTHQHTQPVTYDQLSPGQQHVVRVNQQAQRRGVDVVWVNSPAQSYQDRKRQRELRAAREAAAQEAAAQPDNGHR